MVDEVKISKEQLTEWADSLISMNHHGTLVQREIAAGNLDRAVIPPIFLASPRRG